jgi:hypothetical protein
MTTHHFQNETTLMTKTRTSSFVDNPSPDDVFSSSNCLDAVVVIQSMASMTRCNAESAPMVMSVPQKSLSIEPTRPTIFKCLYLSALFCVISSRTNEHVLRSITLGVLLVETSSFNRLSHSIRKRFAPVNDPSPPIHTILFIP